MESVGDRANRGRHARFRAIYREHYGLVWGAARRFGVEEHQLDDAVQETFLVAYRRLSTFRGGSAKAWLYGITRRVASNYRRSARRTARRKNAVQRTMLVANHTSEAVEAWHAVDRFVADLPKRQREIFVLSELEGMGGAEIARTLELRPSTTYDAIRSLRQRFAEQVNEAPSRPVLRSMTQQQRPAATNRSWFALVAVMPRPPVAQSVTGWPWAWWSSLTVSAKTTFVGLGVVAAVAAVGSPARTIESSPDSARAEYSETPRSSEPASRDAPEPSMTSTQERGESVPAPTAGVETFRSARPPSARTIHASSPHASSPHAREDRPAAPPAAARGLAEENALLRDATAALATGDAARALALTDQHARDFGSSPMQDVRIALRIESLCALGKRAQARGEALVFIGRRPSSPLVDRVEGACPNESSEAP